MKINLIKAAILLILFSIDIVKCFKCGADKIKLNPQNIETTEEEERRRLDTSFQTIRIAADYTTLQKPSSMDNDIFEKIKDLIEGTFDEFKKFLMVQPVKIDLSNKLEQIKQSCNVETVGSDYANFLINYDLIIFPQFNDTMPSQTFAGASFCLTATSSKRPVVGVLYLNPNLLYTNTNLDIYMKNILLHEITHILGFTPRIFQTLNLVTESDSVYYIISPKALSKARQHFNCASISGIPLENQGGQGSMGSHWEARYMLGDYMISTNYSDTVLSDITLALLEDFGFYKVNYYSGGLFKFGKNKGCDFFNEKCINRNGPISEEFCISPNQPMCTASRTNKGSCVINDYNLSDISIPEEYQYFDNPNYGGMLKADFCPVANGNYSSTYYYPGNCKIGISNLDSDYGEKIGDNSFCFISSLLPTSSNYNTDSRAICYEVQCDSNNKQIIINIGSLTINCPTSGGTISNPSGFKGNITCPKYIDICDFKDNVMCNEMFDCLTKKVETDENSYMYGSNEINDSNDSTDSNNSNNSNDSTDSNNSNDSTDSSNSNNSNDSTDSSNSNNSNDSTESTNTNNSDKSDDSDFNIVSSQSILYINVGKNIKINYLILLFLFAIMFCN